MLGGGKIEAFTQARTTYATGRSFQYIETNPHIASNLATGSQFSSANSSYSLAHKELAGCLEVLHHDWVERLVVMGGIVWEKVDVNVTKAIGVTS